MSAAAPLGFLGIGAMGLPMATNIHNSGLEVRVADVSEAQVDKAIAAGMAGSTNVDSLAVCSALLCVVATGDQLMGLLDGALFAEESTVQTVVVMSTVGAVTVVEFANALAARGIDVVDCPITGGVAGAAAGSLTLFASGDASVIDRVRPALRALGTVENCGDEVGNGQSVKMVNQLLAAANLAVAGEALALASSLGLDPELTLRLVSSGAGASWMLADRGPRMIQAPDERAVLTHLNIFAKDSALVLDAAREAGFSPRILETVADKFRDAADAGLGKNDDSAIIDIDRVTPPA